MEISEKIAVIEAIRGKTVEALEEILLFLADFCDVPICSVVFRYEALHQYEAFHNKTTIEKKCLKEAFLRMGELTKFDQVSDEAWIKQKSIKFFDASHHEGDTLVKFAAVAPIFGRHDAVVGALFLADLKPREFSAQQKQLLAIQANHITRELILRLSLRQEINYHEKLAESKRQLRLVLDNAPAMIWFKDDKNNILKTNRPVAESIGLPLEEIEGHNASEFFSKDDAASFHANDLKVIESGKPHLATIAKYVAPNGDVNWTSTDRVPYIDDKTGERFVLNIATDITQLRKIKDKATSDAERFEFVANASLVGLWDWPIEPRGEIWWSPVYHRMVGDPDRKLKPSTTNFSKVVHPDDLEPINQCVRDHLKDKAPFSIECRIKDQNNDYKWYLVTGLSRWNDNGRSERITGSLMDIDRLKTVQFEYDLKQKQLLEANKELDHFAYVASHDLKAPLRGMSNLLEWVAEDIAEGNLEDIAEKLELLDARVRRMDMLLKDILSFSRAGEHIGVIETISVKAMVKEILAWLSIPDGLTVTLMEPLPVLETYKTPLEQVFLNLLSNAIKYHDKVRGHVGVSCKETVNNYIFTVSDDGPGIPKEFRESVFEPFKRLISRDEVEGSGLGLSIVKKMVKSLGGDIWLEENSVETGTIIRFIIPKVSVLQE